MSESSSRPMISPRLALRLFRALSSALFLLVHLPAANGQAQDEALQIQRDQKLLFVSFTLDQP